MSLVPHELADEFPDQIEKMLELRVKNQHFAHLMDEYSRINQEIYLGENQLEPMSDETENDMRRLRVRLKDQIAALLAEI
jgi:Uncharacterized protein conserved in bacteria